MSLKIPLTGWKTATNSLQKQQRSVFYARGVKNEIRKRKLEQKGGQPPVRAAKRITKALQKRDVRKKQRILDNLNSGAKRSKKRIGRGVLGTGLATTATAGLATALGLLKKKKII